MTRLWIEVVAMSLMFSALLAAVGNTQERVTVRLPDGRVVQVESAPERPWWRSPELGGHERFYFVPEEGVYRVFDDPKSWPSPQRWDERGHRVYGPAAGQLRQDGAPVAPEAPQRPAD